MNSIVKQKQGQLIVDFYSYYSFDELIKVEQIESNIFKLYWKVEQKEDYLKNLLEVDSIFTLIKIGEIKVDKKIYIKAEYIQEEYYKKILQISEILELEDKKSLLYSSITYIDNKKCKHNAIISNLPFYCIAISNKGSNFSRDELYRLNMEEICIKYDKIQKFMKENTVMDDDEIGEKGNALRKILERVLKLYIILNDYDNKKNCGEYDRLVLGKLIRILKDNKDSLYTEIDDRVREISNKFSHDSGVNYKIDDLIYLRDECCKIIKLIIERNSTM